MPAVPSPPQPPLTFRVGIVGHRPDRLKGADLPALRSVFEAVLRAVLSEVNFAERGRHSPEGCEPAGGGTDGPRLIAVSPLAEGTDRIFAEVALDLGFELCCVMPFAESEFANDFKAPRALESESLARFTSLLGRADSQTRLTRVELTGSRADEEAAYRASGRATIDESDLLIAVWDGEPGKPGGTKEMFDDALQRGVTVVWVDARAPHAWQVLNSGTKLPMSAYERRLSPVGPGSLDRVRESVREIVASGARKAAATGRTP